MQPFTTVLPLPAAFHSKSRATLCKKIQTCTQTSSWRNHCKTWQTNIYSIYSHWSWLILIHAQKVSKCNGIGPGPGKTFVIHYLHNGPPLPWSISSTVARPGQAKTGFDRTDIISQDYWQKFKAFIREIYQNYIFCKCLGRISVIEFQKRGAPRTHTLLWIKDFAHTADNIYDVIPVEIPCQGEDGTPSHDFHDLLMKTMIHIACGGRKSYADWLPLNIKGLLKVQHIKPTWSLPPALRWICLRTIIIGLKLPQQNRLPQNYLCYPRPLLQHCVTLQSFWSFGIV